MHCFKQILLILYPLSVCSDSLNATHSTYIYACPYTVFFLWHTYYSLDNMRFYDNRLSQTIPFPPYRGGSLSICLWGMVLSNHPPPLPSPRSLPCSLLCLIEVYTTVSVIINLHVFLNLYCSITFGKIIECGSCFDCILLMICSFISGDGKTGGSY